MDENQVILSLLDLYKSKGLDLHYLLDSPLFNSLPVQSRIAMIRKYAGDIAAGTSSGFGPSEIRRALWDVIPATITGAAAGFGTAKAVASTVGRAAHPLAVALAALTGAGVGTGVAYLRNAGAVADKDNLKRQLEMTASHPTTENALQAIEMNNLAKRNRNYERETMNPYLQKVLNKAPQWSQSYAAGASHSINKLPK